jgi:beta-phosphoglucomutase-like phosphatase (HAD superfamily)
LLELDGAVVDVVQHGHRAAFNRAFAELGVPQIASWSPREFEQSLRQGSGGGVTGEQLVAARLEETAAWPAEVAALLESKRRFARRLHEAKQRMFAEMVDAGALPLRPDVAAVIDAALASGAVVALVTETASSREEGVAGAALRALGEARAGQVRVLTAGLRREVDEEEEEREEGSQGATTAALLLLQAAVARRKAAAAREFAEQLGSLWRGSAGGIDVSVALMAGGAGVGVGAAAAATSGAPSSSAVLPAFFFASALLLGVPASRCACVAATPGTVRAAAAAGMVAVAVPRQAAFDVSFDEAAAKFEAFGPGYLTWPRLRALVEKSGGGAAR